MIPVELAQKLPGMVQGAKQLVRYAANLFGALLALQVLGWERHAGVESPLLWWQSLGLFGAFALVEYLLGDAQEKAKAAGTGTGSQPPAPGA
jgi:hypothetical protein